jgi:SAM-dependent methyltransferase
MASSPPPLKKPRTGSGVADTEAEKPKKEEEKEKGTEESNLPSAEDCGAARSTLARVLDVRDVEAGASASAAATSWLRFSALVDWRGLRTGDRLCELPPKGAQLLVVFRGGESDADAGKAEESSAPAHGSGGSGGSGTAVPPEFWATQPEDAVVDFLVAHGYAVLDSLDERQTDGADSGAELWEQFDKKWKCGGVLSAPPDTRVLWRPNPYLEAALPVLEGALGAESAAQKNALDVACGSGRDGVYLAMQGWTVVGSDVNKLLLAIADRLAERSGCAERFATHKIDLENDREALDEFRREHAGRYELVHVARYLHRELFPVLRELVRPGGTVFYHTFMSGVEAFGKPRRPRFILQPGELKTLFSGWTVLDYQETTLSDGRPVQLIAAQKPGGE